MVFEQGLELSVLLGVGLVLGGLLAQPIDLSPVLVALRLRVDEAGKVAVEIAERPRDALRGDLERVQDGRAGALHLVETTARGLSEVDRHKGDREHDKHPCHDSPLEGAARARGVRGGPGTRSGRTQDRQPCGAVPWHERASLGKSSAGRAEP